MYAISLTTPLHPHIVIVFVGGTAAGRVIRSDRSTSGGGFGVGTWNCVAGVEGWMEVGSRCYFSTAVIVVVIYSCPYYNGGSLLICALSLSNAYIHTHTHMYFRSIEKKVHATVSPMNPCVVRVVSDAKKIVNFRHFFSFTFRCSSLRCVTHTRIIHTAALSSDRPGIGVIKEKSNVFDTITAAESRCC